MVVLSPGSGAAQDAPVPSCSMRFEATVGAGPNAGLVLIGNLVFEVSDDGQLPQGWLIPDTGAPIPVSGQITGRSIGLLFDLGDENVIFGTGIADGNLMECAGSWDGELGGPFAGPDTGDLGDWKVKGRPRPGTLNITADGTVLDDAGEVVLDGGCIDDPAACAN